VPGVGKTALATALAESLGCEAARIQFTSDLLPADLTGTAIPDRVTGEFVFHPGPLFTNVVIADEINRASPRTQSALIECMAEGQVSVDGITRPLPRPFLVIATQNPADMAGTFPLPEAQRDRFTACLHLGYPQPGDEQRLVRGRRGGVRPPADPSITRTQLLALGDLIAQVHISAETAAYLVGVVSATRTFPGVRLGASPRASLQLAALARAWAALDGRDAVLPDDVAGVAVMGSPTAS
jgi:MoxR-like ATPase